MFEVVIRAQNTLPSIPFSLKQKIIISCTVHKNIRNLFKKSVM